MQEYWWVITAGLVGGGILVALGRWSQSVDDDRALFKDFITEIRDEIKQIKGKLEGILIHLGPDVIKSTSPLTLTDLGEKISREVNAKAWADAFAEKIKESTQDMQPYEIQEYCKELVRIRHKFTDAQEQLIKKSAYENAVKREKVLDVFAIELRARASC